MNTLELMLEEVTNGLGSESERFDIIDDLHIHDTQSGLKFHMYDAPEPFHISMFECGTEVAHMRDFMDKPELLKLFRKLKEKLIKVYEGIAEINRTNLLSIYNSEE